MKPRRVLTLRFAHTLLAAVFLAALSGACANPFALNQQGALRLSIDSPASRTIMPNLDLVVASYAVSGSGPDGATFSVPAFTGGGSFNQDGLGAGAWTITVQAKNAAGTVIGSGSGSVTVVAGQTATCTITVSRLPGASSFACTVTWPAASLSSPAITGTVADASGTTQNLSFTLSGTQADATINLSAGCYSLSIALTEGGAVRWKKADALLVVAGQQTGARFDLIAGDIAINQLMAPQFSVSPGTYAATQSVAISTLQAGASVYYTTNGTTPSASNGTLYSAALSVASTRTIKAVAVLAGYVDSAVQTGTFTIGNTPAAPTFDVEPGLHYSPFNLSLAASNSVDGFVYEKSSGTAPAPSMYTSTPYSAAFSVGSGTWNIKALSYKGTTESMVSEINCRVTGYASQPTITPTSADSDTAVSVTLSANGSGETLWYTTDGSIPSASHGTQYTGAFIVSSSSTVKAVAVKTDWGNSTVASQAIQIRAKAPTSSIAAGTFTSVRTIDLGTATSGATIYYTLDNSVPSATNGSAYSAPFVLNDPATLRAVAIKGGIDASPELSLAIAYTCAAPVPNAAAGTYDNDQSITLSSATAGASIRYTTNGVVPTSTVGALFAAGSPIAITQAKTIKAIAYKSGWQDSAQVDFAYVLQCATPTFSLVAGSYSDASLPVGLSTATTGATIYYTIDGSDPASSASRQSYGSSSFTLSASTTVKAVAVRTNYSNSDVGVAGYVVGASLPGTSNASATKPTLIWPKSLPDQAYKVELANDSGFSSILDSASELSSPSWTATVALSPTDNTTYYWRFAAKTNGSYGGWSTTQQLKVWVVGKAGPAGGWIFYDAGNSNAGWRWMECAPSDQSTGIQWGNGSAIDIAGAKGTAIGTGQTNTTAIVAAQGAENFAAKLCDDLMLSGYSDWFLPSKNELNAMYTTLQTNGIGGFSSTYYWSSSEGYEYGSYIMWYQNFTNGNQAFGNNSQLNMVRAVRQF
jgi:hypothetical protein